MIVDMFTAKKKSEMDNIKSWQNKQMLFADKMLASSKVEEWAFYNRLTRKMMSFPVGI